MCARNWTIAWAAFDREIILQPTPEAATSVAARVIARILAEKTTAVLGLATGSTPLLLYRELIAMQLDWRRVTTFNLDEYVGLDAAHPQWYHSFMWEHLFRQSTLPKKNIHIPDGMTVDWPRKRLLSFYLNNFRNPLSALKFMGVNS